MDKASKDVLGALSGHQKRELKKKEREAEEKEKETEQGKSQKKKNFLGITITLLILILFAVGIGWLFTNKTETYTDTEVHWHALVDIEICGEHRDLPLADDGDLVHGKTFKGTHLMHTHDDNTIHIEGLIQKKEDIGLGNFFDAIEVPFDKDKILDVKNGDLCEGKPGTLKMYVNDKPRDDFREYVPFATGDARKQVIKLVFAPEETNSTSEEKSEKTTESVDEESAENTTQSS